MNSLYFFMNIFWSESPCFTHLHVELIGAWY
ncbi:hypothetical protein SAMN05421779_103583 [Insolitispirillum peregrinum]|uniref:Uncharacterized protein n=1 Tax=Insolitispirillum peregrinum TaxID=80876 RepID=A0A1N7LVN3_9PROT|nr:hypothetical protein SAMN05421779_103583 [Insolitispirillum peregrinum]